MIKVMLVFGTRPEAIKMCPVVNTLKSMPQFSTVVCVTGQHKEMLKQVLDVFKVHPDYNLNIMKDGQTLFDVTTAVLHGLRPILDKERPDIVLVHGDTTTSFSASLAAFYLNIPVGHVEAGLRTHNIHSPYPEEFNRQATGIISYLHFAPTQLAADNLISEGKNQDAIFVTGNTVIDALKTTVKTDYYHPVLEWAQDSKMVLMTAHRRENIGKPMHNIFKAVKRVVDENENIKIIYPIHLNPLVRKIANQYFEGNDRIKLIEPLDVFDFHNFMARASLILTDSGGMQEEAPSLGKPVLVLRDTTERPEGLKAGTLLLAGTDEHTVYKYFSMLLNDNVLYGKMSTASNPYGDGNSSKIIADIILQKFSHLV